MTRWIARLGFPTVACRLLANALSDYPRNYPRNEETTVVRKVLIALVVIFLVYAVINSPTQSGQVTANIWGDIKDGLSAVGTFFDTLLSR